MGSETQAGLSKHPLLSILLRSRFTMRFRDFA
jgi:hypothetical protein